ncbi:uncharacterized protein BDR25DRAFT_391642 [Lindgomyces ingoldianus]|uniref:Uncharacterized protein n=1 Tax=Lindgomyces ingoldianus TaxID=673940 RepID=A0ACB6R7J3_9PLEO|nr:uncharacterized protein BDR25DRAFT_391642 [Lindgomyces ingoldianus]KAF2474492.1 hypothetical protein BDR25DRAFT_391642 [Lindgomyces ingoldianus]
MAEKDSVDSRIDRCSNSLIHLPPRSHAVANISSFKPQLSPPFRAPSCSISQHSPDADNHHAPIIVFSLATWVPLSHPDVHATVPYAKPATELHQRLTSYKPAPLSHPPAHPSSATATLTIYPVPVALAFTLKFAVRSPGTSTASDTATCSAANREGLQKRYPPLIFLFPSSKHPADPLAHVSKGLLPQIPSKSPTEAPLRKDHPSFSLIVSDNIPAKVWSNTVREQYQATRVTPHLAAACERVENVERYLDYADIRLLLRPTGLPCQTGKIFSHTRFAICLPFSRKRSTDLVIDAKLFLKTTPCLFWIIGPRTLQKDIAKSPNSGVLFVILMGPRVFGSGVAIFLEQQYQRPQQRLSTTLQMSEEISGTGLETEQRILDISSSALVLRDPALLFLDRALLYFLTVPARFGYLSVLRLAPGLWFSRRGTRWPMAPPCSPLQSDTKGKAIFPPARGLRAVWPNNLKTKAFNSSRLEGNFPSFKASGVIFTVNEVRVSSVAVAVALIAAFHLYRGLAGTPASPSFPPLDTAAAMLEPWVRLTRISWRCASFQPDGFLCGSSIGSPLLRISNACFGSCTTLLYDGEIGGIPQSQLHITRGPPKASIPNDSSLLEGALFQLSKTALQTFGHKSIIVLPLPVSPKNQSLNLDCMRHIRAHGFSSLNILNIARPQACLLMLGFFRNFHPNPPALLPELTFHSSSQLTPNPNPRRLGALLHRLLSPFPFAKLKACHACMSKYGTIRTSTPNMHTTVENPTTLQASATNRA